MSDQMTQLLRKKIEQSNMSYLALAAAAGVPQPRIWDFMHGKDIRLTTAQKLADYFRLTLVEESNGGRLNRSKK